MTKYTVPNLSFAKTSYQSFSQKLLFGLLILLSSISILTHAKTADPLPSEADFQKWLQQFKPHAIAAGVSPQTVTQAFSQIHLNYKVLELDRRQPEFTQTFWGYFNRAVTPWRVQQGQKLYQQHRTLLDQVTQKYGVPGRFLIAFWGLETNYGNYTGNTPTIEALATLSFDRRRSKFFQKELIAALKILDRGDIPFQQMKGSWAGAIGQSQFMPSNVLRYAVDGDDDGKIDLWHSLPDIFYSMGNFLKHLGWRPAENWGREVKLPTHFNLALADGKTKRTLPEWAQMGLRLADGRPLPKQTHKPAKLQAALLLPSDYRGPFFLVYPNFYVIKRWNHSDKYALAVGHLADRIIGRPPLSVKRPADDQPLSKQHIKNIQTYLLQQGYTLGKADGIAGNKTRAAIRHYQHQHQLPADGQPSHRLLKHLQQRQNND